MYDCWYSGTNPMTAFLVDYLEDEFFFLHIFFVSSFFLQTGDEKLRTGAKKERCLQGKSLLLCTLLLSTLVGFTLLITYIMMTCGLGIICDIIFLASSSTPFLFYVPLLYIRFSICVKNQTFRISKKHNISCKKGMLFCLCLGS